MNEEYYVVSYDGTMIAMVTIKEVKSFNSEKFISDLTKDTN